MTKEERIEYNRQYRLKKLAEDPDWDKKQYQKRKEKDPDFYKKQYQKAIERDPDLCKKHYRRTLELHPDYIKNIYIKAVEKDPDFGKKQYQKAIDRDPDFNKKQYQKRKEKDPDHNKKEYQKRKDRDPVFYKKYLEQNREHINNRRKRNRTTKKGRASNLSNNYKSFDQQKGFSTEQNITPKWIIENIFSGQSCVYCGDSDWTHLGADRIDNTLPHTPDNVVCACGICNAERADKFTVEGFKQYRALHPIDYSRPEFEKYETETLPNGTKVLKKKK